MKQSLIYTIILLAFSCTSEKTENITKEELKAELEKEYPDDKENIDELYAILNGNEVEIELENIAYTPLSAYEKGKLTKRSYTNKYFGFTIQVPESWKILTKSEQQLNQTNKEAELAENKSEINTKIETSKPNWNSLLSLQQGDWLPGITFMSEKIEPIPNVTNALEYLEYTQVFMKENYSTGYPTYSDGTVSKDSVGSKVFLVQTFEIETENEFYYQKTFCAQYGDYLLNIITNYQNVDQENELRELLSIIEWHSKD
jgi:hypothetical protein